MTSREPSVMEPVAASGSNRRYWHVDGLVGCVGDDVEENGAFIYLSGHFAACGLNVPRVLAVSGDCRCYLQESLGRVSLYDMIADRRFAPSQVDMLVKTIRYLPQLQHRGAEGIDFGRCYPQEAMDGRMVAWDLNYFKYCFLKPSGVEFNEAALQDDFDALQRRLLDGENEWDTFMYRDFQSRNVMVVDGEPWFIDFQGGRRGPVYYDVASFIWQARAAIPDGLRERLIDEYLDAASCYCSYDAADFRRRLMEFVLFRQLQVLGAYGFRGLIENKPQFVSGIPGAIDALESLCDAGCLEAYPALRRVISRLAERYAPEAAMTAAEGLTVTVMSFSYRRGLPIDTSGNGGGFVFDCRAIHNPGRYDRYKPLTGRDDEVIEFLEHDGEVIPFLEHVYALTDAAVEKYRKRGFTSLMVCFGCTGGRHRSVYSAEHTARHLHEKYGVRVVLEHREQNIREVLQ